MGNETQDFYNSMAENYHLIFQDWYKSINYHASIIDKILGELNRPKTVSILDCACGIGTQTLGLAELGYNIIGSDISENEIIRARAEAKNRNLNIDFRVADFCFLSNCFDCCFDLVIAIDNALPHMTTREALKNALESIYAQTVKDGIFIASIRDYDSILKTKPSNFLPNIISTPAGKRIVFQTWDWHEDAYNLTQYIIRDEDEKLEIHKYCGSYRALIRAELNSELLSAGFNNVEWIFPDESGFYQPIVIATK